MAMGEFVEDLSDVDSRYFVLSCFAESMNLSPGQRFLQARTNFRGLVDGGARKGHCVRARQLLDARLPSRRH